VPERGGISVIVNACSGKAGKPEAIDELQALFARSGARVAIERVRHPVDLAARARAAAARGDILAAAGGDGTVSTIAAVAVDTGATLGVLPMGTLNHFAKDLGVPLALDQAVAAVLHGEPRVIDVGEVDGRIFINNSSVGIYPRMVWEREAEQRRGRRKWTASAIAVLRTWRRYRMVVVRLAVEGSAAVVRTPFVFVGNNEYKAEGFELGGRTTLDGGRLSIFLAPECSRFEFLTLPLRAWMTRLGTGAPFASFSAETVTVDVRSARVRVSRDGEVEILRSPLEYRIRPRALRIIAPPPAASAVK
jgi:diacylglycerol kinase family enzyme